MWNRARAAWASEPVHRHLAITRGSRSGPRPGRRLARSPGGRNTTSAQNSYLDGGRVISEDLQDPHDAERQVPRGGEQQRGREAADGNQHLHLTGSRCEHGSASAPGPGSRGLHGAGRHLPPGSA